MASLLCESATEPAPSPKYPCPGGCVKVFDTGEGSLRHLARSTRCMAKQRVAHAAVRANAKQPRVKVAEPRSTAFTDERRGRVVDVLAGLSLDDDMGDAQLGRVRTGVESIMRTCKAELVRRLDLRSRSTNDVSTKEVVDEVLDVFHGLRSQNAVFDCMETMYPYIEPVEHIYGYDEVHTTDAEGFTYSKKKTKCAGYYMPMTRVVERLLQEDPRALEMVLRSQEKWAAERPAPGTTKHIYLDVDDGWLFREHPELGDAQRGKNQSGRVRLCFTMYYDGIEAPHPCNTHDPPTEQPHTRPTHRATD